jgi:hypothetical protein
MEVMTLTEFLHEDYKKIKNGKLEKITIFLMANILWVEKVSAAGVDPAGQKLIGILQNIGYYACIIMCMIDILKALMHGDVKGINAIVAKYVIAYAALFGLPLLFSFVRGLF